MAGEATQAQIGGFLVALRLKGETPDEIAGFAEAIREQALVVAPEARRPRRHRRHRRRRPARRSTSRPRRRCVAAAAGAGVAKHGNRAVSSASGSADVLEALGFDARAAAGADRALDRRARVRLPVRARAPPGFRHAAPVRRELATRTVFNVLGPLTNPAGARAQIVGVYDPALVRTIAEVLVAARRAARVRRPRRVRRRRALARRPEPRLRGRGRRRARARRSTRSTSASPAARPRSSAAARRPRTPRRSARSSPARSRARDATRSCSTRPARSPPAGTRTTSATGSSSRARPSTREPPPSGSRRSSPSRTMA